MGGDALVQRAGLRTRRLRGCEGTRRRARAPSAAEASFDSGRLIFRTCQQLIAGGYRGGMPRLFDELERTDPSPAWPNEDSFSFLNRVTGPVWHRQRELLESWYGEFPDLLDDVRSRFRSRDPRQHYPAWWELYVHALFRALGFRVLVHPSLRGTTGHPDFLVEREGASFYVEAATVFSGVVSPTQESRAVRIIEDTVARIDASTFWVSFRVDRVGTSLPSLGSIRREISDWVATLDVNEVMSADLTDPASWRAFEFQDWLISLRPGAWSPEHRGCPDNRFIGMRTGIGGYIDDVPKLRNAIVRKGKRYGTPDKPLLVAILAANGSTDDQAVVDALFGSQAVQVNVQTGASHVIRNQDGVWISRRGAARRRISAVLLGNGILPSSAARASPTLWHHFDPTFELTADLPFASMRLIEDSLQSSEPVRSPADVFGLASEWPKPEPPFARCEHGPDDHAPR
jgi:hypothetical protein